MTGYQQEGVWKMDATIHQGKRWSAASAYLHPALSRGNLSTLTNVMVTKVLFEGKKAVGIEVIEKGVTKKYRAAEIILSGGAINSPQLLLLSGGRDRRGGAILTFPQSPRRERAKPEDYRRLLEYLLGVPW